MELCDDYQVKPMAALMSGELFFFNLRNHRTVGICAANTGKSNIIAVVDGEEGHTYPFHLEVDHRGECLSIGRDWVLELVMGPETFPKNKSHWNVPGVIYRTGAEIRMFIPVHASQNRGSDFVYDFTADAIDNPSDEGIPYLRWRIWARREDQRTTGVEPLIDFEAKPLGV